MPAQVEILATWCMLHKVADYGANLNGKGILGLLPVKCSLCDRAALSNSLRELLVRLVCQTPVEIWHSANAWAACITHQTTCLQKC